MYDFIDTNEISEGYVLPSEALQINGEYIEHQIEGYRTLNVTGREALSPDVETYETGVRDGSKIKRKKYPERIITVQYQLMAKTNEAFREAYNKLGQILDVENAELIFNDEQDKFFVGTPCTIGAVKPGTNSVVGEFEILCADPFKYSVIEYEAEPDLDAASILVDYNGTYKAYPTLAAKFYNEDDASGALTGKGDCGYIAFFNEDEKIIQLGNPNETDTESYKKSQTLVSQSFEKSTAWGTIAQANWATNRSMLLSSNVQQIGSVSTAANSYLVTTSPTTSGTLLTKRSTAAKPYIDYAVVAEATGREADRVNVKVTITATMNGSSGGTVSITAGAKVTLNKTNLYASSTASSVASTKTGTYYLWDASVKNGRIRITNAANRVGKSGQVTGWVKVADIGATTGGASGFGLKGAIQLGSSGWKYVTIKNVSTAWKDKTKYTVTLNVTVKDLAADTTSIEDIKFKVERTDDNENAKNVGILDETDCADFEISTYTAPVVNGWYIAPSSYGTWNGSGSPNWHGPSITRTIPADAAGSIGAKNFTFTYSQKMAIGLSSYAKQEMGALMVLLVAGSGSMRRVVAGVDIYKGENGTNGKLCFYVDGRQVETVSIDLSNRNKYFGDNSNGNIPVRTSTITKTEGTISFNIGGIKRSYTVQSARNEVVTEITFHFAQYRTKPALYYNGVYWAKFVKNNCDTYNDIPNKFSANDTVEADCRSGEILLNGLHSPSLGALGNDWEEFYLTPGLNQIGFAYSDWVASGCGPKPKVRYREVFL